MKDDTPPKGKGKNLLTVILIVANLLMPVIGIITIPPHFLGWAGNAIRLTQFYELNGKQYAIGTMDTPDGIPAFIGLVRP